MSRYTIVAGIIAAGVIAAPAAAALGKLDSGFGDRGVAVTAT